MSDTTAPDTTAARLGNLAAGLELDAADLHRMAEFFRAICQEIADQHPTDQAGQHRQAELYVKASRVSEGLDRFAEIIDHARQEVPA